MILYLILKILTFDPLHLRSQFYFSVPPAALFNLVAYLYLCAVEPVLLLSGLDDQKPFLMPLRLTSVEGFGPFICRLVLNS
jgi:hypothetical protein